MANAPRAPEKQSAAHDAVPAYYTPESVGKGLARSLTPLEQMYGYYDAD
jgi:hypothetical protein